MISWAYVIFLFLLNLKACNEEGKRSGKRLNYMQNMKCVSMTTAFINLEKHSFYSLIPYRTHIDLIGIIKHNYFKIGIANHTLKKILFKKMIHCHGNMVKVIASSTNMFSFVIKLNFRSLINFNLLFQLYHLTGYLILKHSL